MANSSDLTANALNAATNPTINLTSFTNANDFQINGNASLASSTLRLTPDAAAQRGSAYYKQAFQLDSNTGFSTQFQFRTGGAQGTNGADGLAFVIQGSGLTALGGVGGALGYSGVNNSVAVKFDTYKSAEYGDVSGNNIGILQRGNMRSMKEVNVGLDLNSGAAVNAWVDYSANKRRLDVYLSNGTTKPGSATLSETIDLNSIVGNTAYMGFSGATGGLRNSQAIEKWTASTAQEIVEPTVGAGNGDGLTGNYFDNIDFTNKKFDRVDKEVNFNWGNGSPDARIANDTFSVRWVGQIQPLYTEEYTFTTTTDDGAKLVIDGKTVVDALVNQAATDRSGKITLEAGKKYNIQFDYFENGGGASSQLSWSSAKQVKQIVPKSQLYTFSGLGGLPTILLGTPAVTVNENGTSATMRIDRTAANPADLNVISTVQYTTNNGSAIAGQDYTATVGTATFAAGETSKNVVIPILNDAITESTESFGFNLGATTNAVDGAARTSTITILDDDSAASTIEFSRPDFPVNESAGAINVVVNRSGSTAAAASVKFATSAGTALAGSDYTETTGTLNFAAGETTKNITVQITNDALTEPNEAFNVTLTQAVGATLAARDKATVTISDDDSNSTGNFIREDYINGALGTTGETKLFAPVAFEWASNDTVFIAEKFGVVKVAKNGVLQNNLFLDFTDRINNEGDRGLLDIALHPDFANGKPYVYLYYVFDPTEAPVRDQGFNRPARLTRVRAQQDAAGNWTAVPNSEEIIVGKNSTWANISRPDLDSTQSSTFDPAAPGYNGLIPASGVTVAANGTRTNLKDYIAVDSLSHAGGSILFDSSKNLYLTIGDGTSYSGTDPRTIRVLDNNNLSGKVLRMTDTGDGIADNPYWTGDKTDNASKVFASGFRNPFRAVFGPGGQLAVADVGWLKWEETNIVTKGYNGGWPAFEGGQGTQLRTQGYQDLPAVQAFYNSGQATNAAAYAYEHNASNALLAGAYYTGNTFPSVWKDTLFVTDVAQGWVDALSFNANGTLASSRRFDQDESLKYVTNMAVGPDGNMYFVDLDNAKIGRWRSVASSIPGNTNRDPASGSTQRVIKDLTQGSTFLTF
jgi:Legume lectin domain/PA14 domain/Glucose / Sorbosone dehydrogenase/Calx-beta domain